MKTYPGRVSASDTLDYNAGEFALSQYAKSLGDREGEARYLKMSQNWKNLFNPESGYIQPRWSDGSWYEPFDPLHASFSDKRGFDEGTAATWSFFVQHNLHALFARMGGNAKVVERLDDHFTRLNDGSTFLPFPWMGEYAWIGNEPGFGTPWEYNWAQAPWKTQKLVRRELEEIFSKSYVGDEDLGATSAWAVWASLGLYPEIAGVAGLTVSSPLFPRALVHLPKGKTLEITARLGSGDKSGDFQASPYIQSASLDGKALNRAWIDLPDLEGEDGLRDRKLSFEVGASPNLGWGSGEAEEPPSFDLY
jgi:predicted alpha-1,2-mannosidase